MSSSRDRSMTAPPTLVAMLLMPWPPLRTANGPPCASAKASASGTSALVRTRTTAAGDPVAM